MIALSAAEVKIIDARYETQWVSLADIVAHERKAGNDQRQKVSAGERRPRREAHTATRAAIAALMNASTLERAAAQCGIGVSTLRRWLKDEEFAAQYREAKRALVQATTARLRKEMEKGVRVLASIAGNSKAPAASRVSSAVALIRLGLEAHQSEDLEQRIEQLERELEKEKR